MDKVENDIPFYDEVVAETPNGYRIRYCIQCGTCGGSCPNGADMQFTPRELFAMVVLNEEEKVLSANTMWKCVSCYYCTMRCPREIPVTDVMYTLKRLSIRKRYAKETDAPALARHFTHTVDRYGRAFEMGIATRQFLSHPLKAVQMTGLGMSMLKRGRMGLKPSRVKNLEQFKAILDRARTLGGEE